MSDHTPDARRRRVAPLAAAVLGLAVGGGLALLASARPFTTVHVARTPPLPTLAVGISGRVLEPAVFGLAVAVTAGVVAVPAARGRARQFVGGLLTVCAAALIWRSVTSFATVGPDRARALVLSARSGVTLDPATTVRVQSHGQWPALAVLGGLIALAAATLVTVRGRRWDGLGNRYESPIDLQQDVSSAHRDTAVDRPVPALTVPDAEPDDADDAERTDTVTDEQRAAARASADLELWRRLDRGEDPTASPRQVGERNGR